MARFLGSSESVCLNCSLLCHLASLLVIAWRETFSCKATNRAAQILVLRRARPHLWSDRRSIHTVEELSHRGHRVFCRSSNRHGLLARSRTNSRSGQSGKGSLLALRSTWSVRFPRCSSLWLRFLSQHFPEPDGASLWFCKLPQPRAGMPTVEDLASKSTSSRLLCVVSARKMHRSSCDQIIFQQNFCTASCAAFRDALPYPPDSTTWTSFEQDNHKNEVYFSCAYPPKE